MKCQQMGRARARTTVRHWTAFASILLMAQFFAVAGPLRGQEPSRKALGPFESLHRSLEVAADEQLVLIRTEQLVGIMVPRAKNDARLAGGASSPSPEPNAP